VRYLTDKKSPITGAWLRVGRPERLAKSREWPIVLGSLDGLPGLLLIVRLVARSRNLVLTVQHFIEAFGCFRR
jgi:hypothetical protein